MAVVVEVEQDLDAQSQGEGTDMRRQESTKNEAELSTLGAQERGPMEMEQSVIGDQVHSVCMMFPAVRYMP